MPTPLDLKPRPRAIPAWTPTLSREVHSTVTPARTQGATQIVPANAR